MTRPEELRSMSDGSAVYCRRWTPEGDSKATVFLVHGLAEHCGRYDHVARALTAARYTVSGFDLRGFGRTPGPRGHMRFTRVLQDIDELLAAEREAAGGRPVFLFGHSLGGLLVLNYVMDYRPALAGVVASAPGLHTALRDQRAKVVVARILGALLPTASIPTGLDDTKLMRDPEALSDFREDPLVHHKASLGFGRDGLAAIDRVLAGADRFPLPLLLVHGTADEVNFLSGSEEFNARHPGDCTLKTYEGAFHDLKAEPEWPQIAGDIIAWLDSHILLVA